MVKKVSLRMKKYQLWIRLGILVVMVVAIGGLHTSAIAAPANPITRPVYMNRALMFAYGGAGTTPGREVVACDESDIGGIIAFDAWTITYGPGVCEKHLMASHHLPRGANAALRHLTGYQSTLYFRMDGSGTYRVCFNGVGSIYRFISGDWVEMRVGFVGGQTCVSSLGGDSSFAFVP